MPRSAAPISPLLHQLATHQSGAFTRAQAVRLGHHDQDLRAWITHGAIRQAARGAYFLTTDDVTRLPPAERATQLERSRASALLLVLPPTLVASHTTALVLHGLPRLGAPDGRVHVMATTRSARTSRASVSSHALVPGTQFFAGEPRRVSVADAIAQTTCLLGLAAGVVAGEAALHRQLVELASIDAATQRLAHRRGATAVRQLPALLDPASESVGESRLRLICLAADIAVTSRVEVRDAAGVMALLDLAVDGTTVGLEFDGLLKSREDADALDREKLRQERLERAGWRIIRVTWSDLDDPALVISRIRTAVAATTRKA